MKMEWSKIAGYVMGICVVAFIAYTIYDLKFKPVGKTAQTATEAYQTLKEKYGEAYPEVRPVGITLKGIKILESE
jgi:hypothetical protein